MATPHAPTVVEKESGVVSLDLPYVVQGSGGVVVTLALPKGRHPRDRAAAEGTDQVSEGGPDTEHASQVFDEARLLSV